MWVGGSKNKVPPPLLYNAIWYGNMDSRRAIYTENVIEGGWGEF